MTLDANLPVIADLLSIDFTINNLPVFRVGEVIEALREAGFDIEIKISKPTTVKGEP